MTQPQRIAAARPWSARRPWVLVFGLYGVCAAAYWTWAAVDMQAGFLLKQIVAWYLVAFVLVGATEAWLRLWPSPQKTLPAPVPRRQAWAWWGAAFGGDVVLLVAFWSTVDVTAARVKPLLLPLLPLGLPLPLAGRLLNAILAAPGTAWAAILGWVRWRRARPRPWYVSGWALGLALWLALADLGVAAVVHATGARQWQLLGPGWDVFPGLLTSVAMFGAQMAVNGFPEEVLYRGIVLPELRTVLRDNTPLALLGMIVLFDASHIPAILAGWGASVPVPPWWQVVGDILFPAQPVGLFMGYLYLRTRSLVPGIALHTFTTLWGIFV
jgi:membrane protease YdiL (CAAX protease family)